jgi:uncharacterized membrane protein YhhN
MANIDQKQASGTIRMGTITIFLTGLAALLGGLTIGFEIADVQSLVFIFRPATTTVILIIVLLSRAIPSRQYKWMIVFGLGFSLVADSMLMLAAEQINWGMLFFSIAAFFYTYAFVSVKGFYRSPASAAIFALFGIILLVLVWSVLGDGQIPAVIITLIYLVMGWQAFGQWRQTAERRALFAFVGALLFMASVSLLAINQFLSPLPEPDLFILSTYFIGQWFIAMSAGAVHP